MRILLPKVMLDWYAYLLVPQVVVSISVPSSYRVNRGIIEAMKHTYPFLSLLTFTNNIMVVGAATLARMVTMLQTSTFYVIGRSAVRFSSQQKKLEDLNPTCKIVFLEAEVSFLSEVDAVCKQISAATDRVDYLYMSPGIFPLNVLECMFLDRRLVLRRY